MKSNLLYFQSGGPTSVINSSLYGLFMAASSSSDIGEIYGAKYGIEGVLAGDFVNLREIDETQMELLKQTPDMFLGSSRLNLPNDYSSPLYEQIAAQLDRFHIDAVFVNGGNDSMLTAMRLHGFLEKRERPIKVYGIPKTIDNDLCGLDHTLGYPSAALHAISLTKCVAIDGMSYKKGKIQIVETMGRDTGWLAAATDLLEEPYHPDFILIPELKIDEETFYHDLMDVYDKKGRALVVLSEGVNFLVPQETDPFGHECLEGAANSWKEAIKKRLGQACRTTIFSSPMRSDPTLASQVDIEEAIRAGESAFEYFLMGLNGVLSALKRTAKGPYSSYFEPMPLDKVASKVKYMPQEFLCDYRHMSEAFREYLRPLLKKREISTDERGIFLSAKSPS